MPKGKIFFTLYIGLKVMQTNLYHLEKDFFSKPTENIVVLESVNLFSFFVVVVLLLFKDDDG